MHAALNCKFGNTYVPLGPEKLEEFRVIFKELEVIIIDEMSMVSSNNLYDIHKRLCTIFQDHSKIFGGKAVILLGDLLQLKPVKGRPIFTEPNDKEGKMQRQALFHSSLSIWKMMEVVSLEVNFRQGEGTRWLHCLNRIRVAQSYDDLTEEDKEFLKAMKVKKEIFWKFKKNTCHIFYTNKEVEDHNNALLGRQKGQIFQAVADIRHTKGYKPNVNPHGTVDSTNFLKTLRIKVGVRVMMIFNVNTADSLINGAMGTVIDVITKENSNEIKVIIVKFDNEKAGREQRKTYNSIASKYEDENGTPVFISKLEYFPEGKKKMKEHSNKVTIYQFPLKLAYASTAHKMQGVTVTTGTDLVCHGHKKMPKGMGYVMASRVESYENLHLSKSFDIENSFIADEKSLAEKHSLDKRSILSAKQTEKFDIFFVNIANLHVHFKDLNGDPTVKNARYVGLVETWLDQEPSWKNFQLPGYTLLHTASFGAGKGCCFYSKFSEVENVILKHKMATEKFQFISVVLSDENLQLTIIYLSNECQKSDFEYLITQLTTYLCKEYDQLIIGDFNFDKFETNSLSKFFKEQGLTQKVDRPTRVSGRTIDHVYTNRSDLQTVTSAKDKIVTQVKEKLKSDDKGKCLDENMPISVKSVYYSDHTSIRIKFPSDDK